MIPRECLCDRSAPLRVVADAHADATTIATLDALTEATRASSPGATPAFVVRVPHLATDDGHKNARRSAMTLAIVRDGDERSTAAARPRRAAFDSRGR